MNKLKVFKDATDITQEMSNYLLDDLNMTLLSSEYINVGYYKPINSLFASLKTFNTNSSKISVYFYNGTSFISTSILDETKGFSRSGFISWDRNLTRETMTTVNGIEAYWYKIKVDADTSAMVMAGLDLVFSSDQDLLEEYPSVMDMLPENTTSFIGFHVASRKDIISYFKSQGKIVTTANGNGVSNGNKTSTKLVDQFDLLNFEEVRDASKFLTLSKILYWVSDAVDDKWYQKAKMYESKYGDKISMVNLSIDKNDNGLAESTELNAIQFVTVVRQ